LLAKPTKASSGSRHAIAMRAGIRILDNRSIFVSSNFRDSCVVR
jgi:hypothetical protein